MACEQHHVTDQRKDQERRQRANREQTRPSQPVRKRLPLDPPGEQAERCQACRDDQPHAQRSDSKRAERHIGQQTQPYIEVQQQDEAKES